MTFIVKEEGSFKQIPVGTYPGRCVRLIGIGTQHGEWLGKPIKRIQTIISWELPTELIEDGDYAGKPYMVSKFYTHSLAETATLRKHLVSWRGRDFTPEELQGFDLTNIVGKPCMVSVIHNKKGKATVDGIMALPKGLIVPPQVNPTVIFNVFQWDDEVFNTLSDGIKEMIKKSDEYQYLQGGCPVNGTPNITPGEEEIPF